MHHSDGNPIPEATDCKKAFFLDVGSNDDVGLLSMTSISLSLKERNSSVSSMGADGNFL